MSRKLRTWYPGVTYHITTRGNRQAPLFYDNADRVKYLSLFEEAREKFPCVLHSYCLMTNHTHLLLETIDHHPGDIMKHLNACYAMYFNKRYALSGHLFQGRYGSEIINSSRYFLEASRYIHLNPVEAGITKDPALYRWSSCHAYISSRLNPHVYTEKILSCFPSPAKEQYRRYLLKDTTY